MKKNLHYLGLILIIALTFNLSACFPIYYASNAHNVPLLKEKHETHLNVGITATEYLAGPDFQAAYAIGEHVGIIANGAYLNGSGISNYKGHGYQLEAGSGYFQPVGNKFVTEIYGGAGFGKVTNQHNEESFQLNFIKPFVQPTFGFTSTYFDIALSPKIAWVSYKDPFILEYEYVTDANGNIIVDSNGNATYHTLKTKQTFFAFEPGLTIRGGWKYAKMQLQAVQSFQNIPAAENFSLNLSLALTLAPRFRKTAE